MSDIDDMFDAFLESASRHFVPESELQALIEDLDLVPVEPVLGSELCDFMCDVWENGC